MMTPQPLSSVDQSRRGGLNSPGRRLPPEIATAPFPQAYEAAVAALERCDTLDECQGWASQSEALSSYAKQAKDKTLKRYADRIQARAVRRAGEILRAIPSATGANLKKEDEGTLTLSRKRAAADAGMSEHQRTVAVRVAKVLKIEFETLVESDSPPTVTQLAERGRQRRDDTPKATAVGYKSASDVAGIIRRFHEFCENHDAVRTAALFDFEACGVLKPQLKGAAQWLDVFFRSLPTFRATR